MNPQALAKLLADYKWRKATVAEFTAIELGRFGQFERVYVRDDRTSGTTYLRVKYSNMIVKMTSYAENKSNEYEIGEPLSTQLGLRLEN